MEETFVNLGMILAGSIAGVLLQKKLPAAFQERAIRLVGFFILAIGLRIFLKYHQPVLVLLSLFLGTGLGVWWKMGARVTQLGSFLLKNLTGKKIFFPTTSPFSEGFCASSLLFCIGSFAILAGFSGASHGLWSIRLALAFLPAVILASTLGWGVLFSILPVFFIQAVMSLSNASVQDFFTENIVSDLSSVGGILIALWGLKISKLTTLDPADLLPALLLSPLVSWAYYSL
jgi:uncharacterized membrane protein YqgA involved in biofilm formation